MNKSTTLSKLSKTQILIALGIFVVVVAAVVVGFSSKNKNLTSGEKALIEYQKSIPRLKKQLESDPENISFNNEYAYSLYVTQHEDAITAYRRALELNPENDKSWNNLGNLYRKTQQYEQALQAYADAIETNPGNLNAYINKAHLHIYDLKQLEEGYQTLLLAIENNPDNVMLRLVLAQIYDQQGLTEAADALYEEVLELDPDNIIARENRKEQDIRY